MERHRKTKLSLFFYTFVIATALFASSASEAKKRKRRNETNNSSYPTESRDYRNHTSGGSTNHGDRDFPTNPQESETPGSLCVHPSEYRYPEKIKYCKRDVESALKRYIIEEYDRKFGYRIRQMNRGDFKIDHLIPLCAGGSNEQDNLWPQHKSVYAKTDRIEESLCRLMASGQLSQADAVEIILDVKHHLEKADRVLSDLLSRLH